MSNIKRIDRKASDNEYMHKDFHGTLCYAIKYLEDHFGDDAVRNISGRRQRPVLRR